MYSEDCEAYEADGDRSRTAMRIARDKPRPFASARFCGDVTMPETATGSEPPSPALARKV